ncbi:MAG: TIGR03545 family protein [Candidatus Cloacimonadota bacterium]|nr:TIGR03545 family protein [Candidatus Cloacimonadota bacterium]
MKKNFKVILYILLFFIIILGLAFLFRNQIADYVIEKSGTAVAGAKVEVDGVYLKPFKLHISWERFQFTDKNNTMNNLFETGPTAFELAFKPLLAGKVLIEQMQMEKVKFDTERATDGAIPKPKKEPKKSSKLMQALKKNLEEEKNNIPIFQAKNLKTKIDVDSLLAILDFKTPEKADSVVTLAEERYEYWHNLLENNNYMQRAKTIEKTAKQIDLDDLNSIDKVQKQISLMKTTLKDSKKLYEEFNKNKKQIEADIRLMKNLKNDIPQWINQDYQKALNMANLQDIDVQNVSLMLFGKNITDGLTAILEKISQAREISEPPQQKKPKEDKMPHLPSFWIKNVIISVITPDDLLLVGKVSDISSDQKKTKKPMIINLQGSQEKVGTFNLNAIFDYRTENKTETIYLDITQVPIRDIELVNFDLLPSKLKKGTANLNMNMNLENELISAKIDFAAENIVFDYSTQPNLDKNLVRISRNITEAIDTVDLQVNVSQNPNAFRFDLNSNVDNIIASQLKKVVSNEIVRARKELERRVNLELNKHKAEAQKIIDDKTAQLQNELDLLNKKVKSQLNVIEGKMQQLENKKTEIEDELKGKAEEGLKNIWDKFN